ncbi:MAG: hypothetical protein V4525_04780 [Pseudomonadota bacterium]
MLFCRNYDGTTVKGTYSYGPQGFRVKKVANGKTLQFLYLPSGELLGEYEPISGGYHVDREHIYVDGKPVAVLTDGGRSNVTTAQPVAPMDLNYVHTDVLGTPRKITHADTGNLVWNWLQDDAFGGGWNCL